MSRRLPTALVAVGLMAAAVLAGSIVFAGGARGQASEPLEFADWTSVDPGANVATGTLRGQTISLSGSNLTGGTVDGSSPSFAGPNHAPALPTSDAIEFTGFPGHSYVLSFGAPVRDPVLHLSTLASTLEFPAGTQITKLSGEPTFTVSGSSVVGFLSGSADASGTVRLSGTFTSIPFTATPVYPPVSEDGILLQVGSAPPLPPDLSLAAGPGVASGSGLVVAPGGEATLPVVVQRNPTSTGRVQLSVEGLPAGVTGTFAPAELGGTATNSVLTVRAAPDAAPIRRRIRIVATPIDATAGPAPRVLVADLVVQGNLAVKVEGIEVTQAVQTYGQPRSLTYDGVALVKGKKTVVRVFADLEGRELEGRARPPFGMALFVSDASGRPKPGSPLFPEWSPRPATLSLNDASLTNAERDSATSAFTFVLPDAWTRGPLRLEARAVGSSSGPGAQAGATLCVVAACGATPSRTLTGITFRDPPPAAELSVLEQVVVLHDANGRVTGLNVVKATPAQIFAKLQALSPVPFHFLDVQNRPADWPRYRATRFASDAAIWEPADAYDEDIGRPGLSMVGVYVLGDNPGVTIGHTAVVSGRADSPGVLWRPVTSVAHEIFHRLGFAHASTACGAGDGEAWPVARGRMDSVGIDTTPGSGGAGAPYRMIADRDTSEAYDLMSYCGITAGDAPHWISARNWNRALGVAPPTRIRVLRVRKALAVRAQLAGSTVKILAVTPTTAPPPPEPAASPYLLFALDAAGRVLASVPVTQHLGTGAAGVEPVVSLDARVPIARVARVEIRGTDGTVVATRAASPAKPRARVVSPAAGRRVGDRATVAVRWAVSDADGDPLEVAIDFSGDGGRTFRNVWAGPGNLRTARLRTELLDATGNARLRLRVSDGFNETVATSARFVVVPRGPVVEIIEPTAGQRADAGGTVLLRGAAVDDRGRRLAGGRLIWRSGSTILGRGATVSATLPGGTRRVRLEARDSAGRTGSASVAVRVRATTPFFVRLSAAPIARRARTAVLVVSATQPSTLTVRGRRHLVDTKVRRIRVPVGAGRSPISLKLTLAAGGQRSVSTLVVTRR